MALFKDLLLCEIAEGIPGPTCSLQFADLGTRVIKIETPDGDKSREWSSSDSDSPIFKSLNRGKESIVIDPSVDDDTDAMLRIAASADVLLVHADPTVVYPDWRKMSQAHPRLVVCVIDDVGSRGAFCGTVGSELTIQAMSGFNRYVGQPGGESCRIGFEIAGVATAMSAFHAIAAALIHRDRSGKGQFIRISSLNALLSMKSILFAAQGSDVDAFQGFHVNGPHWNADIGWKTKDGQITFDFRREDRDGWVAFCNKIGLRHLPDDPHYADWHSTIHIGDRRFTLGEPYRKVFAALTSEEASKIINDLGGTSVKFQDYAEVLTHPQIQYLRVLVEAVDENGHASPQIGTPFRYENEEPRRIFPMAPRLGQHNAAIRAEFSH